MNKLTSEQRVQRAHVRMMAHKATVAFSSILMVGRTDVTEECPTAYTNGRDVTYGKAFVEGLEDKELNAVILHENLHKVYQHHWLWKHLWKENARLANISADYVINLEILDMSKKYPDFIELPEMALVDEKFRGMSTQEVFDKLKEGGKGQGQGGENGEGAEGFDVHDFSDLSAEEQEVLSKEIEQAVRQGALLAGKMAGDQHRSFDDLMKPKVDWREQLREFMSAVSTGKDDSTWRRPSRRWLAQDIYMPSTISESMGPLLVAVDTSGSIGDKELASFLSEIIGICESVTPEALHLIEVDAKVQEHQVYDRENFGSLMCKRSFKGGGGTDMRQIFSFIEERNIKPEAVVVLTDGYTPWPSSLSVPTLWAITERDVMAPVGSSVYLEIDA